MVLPAFRGVLEGPITALSLAVTVRLGVKNFWPTLRPPNRAQSMSSMFFLVTRGSIQRSQPMRNRSSVDKSFRLSTYAVSIEFTLSEATRVNPLGKMRFEQATGNFVDATLP